MDSPAAGCGTVPLESRSRFPPAAAAIAPSLTARLGAVLVLAGLLLFLLSRFVPGVVGRERAFVVDETRARTGVVLDQGRRAAFNPRDRGLVAFYPRVRLDDGSEQVLDTAVDASDLTPVGGRIDLTCTAAPPVRCRAGGTARWRNVVGFGAIALIALLGIGTAALQILRGAPARAGRRQ